MAAKQGGEGRWARTAERRGMGRREEVAGLKTGRRKKEKGRKRKVGRAERGEGKKKSFPISEKVSNTFNSKIKLKDLNLS